MVCFLSRIISHYEYCEGEFVDIKVMLDSALDENRAMNSSSLGMLIRDVWEGKVKPKTSLVGDIKKVTGYFNIRKRPNTDLHKCGAIISEFTDKTIEDLKLLCAGRPGWISDSSNIIKKSIRLIRPLTPCRSNAVAIDGYFLSFEIKINMVPKPTISISTCGREVSLCDIIGKDNTEISLRTIDEAMCLLEHTSPCIGQQIDNENEDKFLKLEVSDSRVVTVTLDNGEKNQRLVSTSCLLVRFRSNACKRGLYTAKLLRNRSIKRKAKTTSNTLPDMRCNLRFMGNIGLENKIAVQKKQLRSGVKRVARVKPGETEMIELVEEDSLDLMEIVKSSNITKVPPNLQLQMR